MKNTEIHHLLGNVIDFLFDTYNAIDLSVHGNTLRLLLVANSFYKDGNPLAVMTILAE